MRLWSRLVLTELALQDCKVEHARLSEALIDNEANRAVLVNQIRALNERSKRLLKEVDEIAKEVGVDTGPWDC